MRAPRISCAYIPPGMENTLPIVGGIKAAIEVEIGSAEVHTHLFGRLFNAFRPSGSRTMSVSLTGATGTEAKMEPWLSVIAMTFSLFWCLYPEYPIPSPLFWPRCWSRRHAVGCHQGAARPPDVAHWQERLPQRPIISPLGKDFVDGRVGKSQFPLGVWYTGTHFHCIPVYQTHKMRLKIRE